MAAEARVLDELTLPLEGVARDVGRPSGPRRRPKLLSHPPRTLPPSLAAMELGELPAHGLAALPAPFTARLRAEDGTVFHLSTSEAERAALAERGDIALDGDEWEALAVAAEADRAFAPDLIEALRERGVTGRLRVDQLLDGVGYEQATAGLEMRFSVARVLARIGARLDEVWTELEGGTVFP
ncbi:MAG: hypothetical protein U0234_20050 [Sandaracinus sp.]